MSLTGKKRKKLTRWIGRADTKFNLVLIDLCLQYLVIMIVTIFFDYIASKMLWHHNEGYGAGQIIIIVVCLLQIFRYAKMIKK